MATEVLAVMLFVGVGIGGGLLLYGLVRAEHDDRAVMRREDGVNTARRDTSDDDP